MKFGSPLLIAIAVFGLSFAAELRADELLDQGLAQLAQKLKSFLQEEDRDLRVVVGDFSGSPRLKASGGVELSRAIATQLEEAGFVVSDAAGIQLLGRFKLSEKKAKQDDQFESLALVIEATILDEDDEELAEIEVNVFGSVALQIAGSTVDVQPDLSNPERQKRLIEQIRRPPTEVQADQIKPSGPSPFAVEILVRNGNRLVSRTPQLDSRQRAFVQLQQGEEYVVRIYNGASFEAAVALAIDGVEMFVDAKDAPKDSRLIIPPETHIEVPGWYISRTNSKAFEIGGYEESVAKRVGNSTGVGTITASFQACWPVGGQRPADEPGGIPKGGKATKQGRDVSKNYKQVVRDFGQIRAVVTVRYDR